MAVHMLLVSYLLSLGGVYRRTLQDVRRESDGLPVWFVPACTWLRRTNP